MNKWKRCKLGEVAEIVGGGTPKTTVPEYWGGNIPWLSVTDFNNGKKYCFDAEKKITERGLNESSTKILKKGQIIISARGTVGVLSVIGRDMAFNQSCYGIDAIGDITYNDFLYYLLENNIDSFHSASYGAVFDTITKETFNQIFVSIPSLPEQRAIASVLSCLDDKIDLLHRQNKTLETMAETLFRQWFVEEAEEDWKVKNIGNVLQTVLGGTPSTSKPEYWDGNIPWINSGEVNNFRILQGTKYITEFGLQKSNTKLLPKGTTVLAITGATLGQVSLLEIDTCANQSVVGVIPNENLPKEYVFLWMKHKIKEIILNETGGAQPHINKNDINETEIVIPDEKSMKRGIEIINSMFKKITKNSFQILTLEKLRDTLLPKLMSGEVWVQYDKETTI